jgi:hypothetical protein
MQIGCVIMDGTSMTCSSQVGNWAMRIVNAISSLQGTEVQSLQPLHMSARYKRMQSKHR